MNRSKIILFIFLFFGTYAFIAPFVLLHYNDGPKILIESGTEVQFWFGPPTFFFTLVPISYLLIFICIILIPSKEPQTFFNSKKRRLIYFVGFALIHFITFTIATPNFLKFPTAYVVERAIKDLSLVNNALENYHKDHGNYPELTEGQIDETSGTLTILNNKLTTPIAYLPELYQDPFTRWRDEPTPQTYACYYYHQQSIPKYLIYSCGPDKTYNLDPARLKEFENTNQFTKYLLKNTYDPTNGTMSKGDIWYSKIIIP